MPPEPSPILELQDVRKSYGDLEVLRGVTASVDRGERIAVIGTSGSGKSTILRLIMTLEAPDSGRVLLGGESVWTEEQGGEERPASDGHLRAMRRRVGMVFQHFELFPHMTTLDNVTLGPRLSRHLSADDAAELGRGWLDRVGLSDKADTHPAQLSGGQKQRVGIARALAMEPEVLLLDEVTSGLDPELVVEVLDVLRSLAESGHATMLFVTHQMEFAREIADRVLFLDAGRILEEGPPDELFSDPKEDRTRRFLQHLLQTR